MYKNEWGDAGAKQTYVQWLEMEVYRLRAVAPAQQATNTPSVPCPLCKGSGIMPAGTGDDEFSLLDDE